jgi:hypothetical protein
VNLDPRTVNNGGTIRDLIKDKKKWCKKISCHKYTGAMRKHSALTGSVKRNFRGRIKETLNNFAGPPRSSSYRPTIFGFPVIVRSLLAFLVVTVRETRRQKGRSHDISWDSSESVCPSVENRTYRPCRVFQG